MAIVSYNSNRIIPAPLVQINKTFEKTGDGEIKGARFNLTLNGTIMAFKGSPNQSGVFYTGSNYDPDGRTDPTYTVGIDENSRLAAIMRKQEAIRDLFSEEGHSLEFQSFDGSPAIKCNPRINNIEFEQGIWYDICRYTINCEADVLYINGTAIGEDSFNQYISECSESWNIETSEDKQEGVGLPRTYIITHNVSAKGKRFYNDEGNLESPAWEQARKYVIPKLGLNNSFLSSSGVKDLPSYYGGYNHVRREETNINEGSYSVTETWLLASGSALEEFNVSINNDTKNGVTTVGIEGNVTGLEERNSNMSLTTSKYDNALEKFNSVSGVFLDRAQTYSGYTLNVVPVKTVIGKNPITGVITYNFEYDNRPSNLIPGVKSEVISLTNSWNVDTFATIFVLGRAAGPVLQSLGTKEAKKRNLSIECVFPAATLSGSTITDYKNIFNTQNPRFTSAASVIQNIIDAADPINNGYNQRFIANQEEVWEPTTGRYSYKVDFVYE